MKLQLCDLQLVCDMDNLLQCLQLPKNLKGKDAEI